MVLRTLFAGEREGHGHREWTCGHSGRRGGGNEVGEWDWHIYNWLLHWSLFTLSLVSLTASHPNVSACMAHSIPHLPIKHSSSLPVNPNLSKSFFTRSFLLIPGSSPPLPYYLLTHILNHRLQEWIVSNWAFIICKHNTLVKSDFVLDLTLDLFAHLSCFSNSLERLTT